MITLHHQIITSKIEKDSSTPSIQLDTYNGQFMMTLLTVTRPLISLVDMYEYLVLHNHEIDEDDIPEDQSSMKFNFLQVPTIAEAVKIIYKEVDKTAGLSVAEDEEDGDAISFTPIICVCDQSINTQVVDYIDKNMIAKGEDKVCTNLLYNFRIPNINMMCGVLSTSLGLDDANRIHPEDPISIAYATSVMLRGI